MSLRETVTVSYYDAFAVAPFTGNQAAVIHGARLNDRQLLQLAAETLMPETAFREPYRGGLALRFATSDRIVSRCGHATLAAVSDHCLVSDPLRSTSFTGTYWVGHARGDWRARITRADRVDVSIRWPDAPVLQEPLPRQEVGRVLGLRPSDLSASLPCCTYDSGNRNGLVPVASLLALKHARPDYGKMERLFERWKLTDLHLYHSPARKRSGGILSARCRNLFPYGVREECATGTASVSLAAALLAMPDPTRPDGAPTRLTCLQGAGSRRGLIHVDWQPSRSGPPTIWLSGQVIRVLTGELRHAP